MFYLKEGRKEENILFNDALNTFYFMVIWQWTHGKGPLSKRGRKEMFYLTMHFNMVNMASDI